MGNLTNVVNLVHLVMCIFMMFGGYFAPLRFLPLVIISNLMLLYRYHDYCFVTQFTEMLLDWERGCTKDFKFTVGLTKEWLGIELDAPTISSLGTFMFMASTLVSLTRLANAYKFKLLPGSGIVSWMVVLGFMAWLGIEIVMAVQHDPNPIICQEGASKSASESDTFTPIHRE
mmetsp:Transcript_8744/g.16040  ORF Transcript_8744/g.16040 Transcript_8744/m.16040 type:complete len:173 (-) Transcript_8744:145-663(-)